MISVIKIEGFPEVNDNNSIWSFFRTISGACEKIDIIRTVALNESIFNRTSLIFHLNLI